MKGTMKNVRIGQVTVRGVVVDGTSFYIPLGEIPGLFEITRSRLLKVIIKILGPDYRFQMISLGDKYDCACVSIEDLVPVMLALVYCGNERAGVMLGAALVAVCHHQIR